MTLEVLADPQSAAERAAAIIAQDARAAVAARGKFSMAVSGGHTPWVMLRALANEDVPWPAVEIFQVDERVAPDGDPDRNLTHLHESLLEHVSISREQIHAMPVQMADLNAAAKEYALKLGEVLGLPAVLDLAHLGLGPDGHTASLVPGDPVLKVTDSDVGVTEVYMGHRRMTLTYPMLNRSRKILWLVTGAEKVAMLPRLQAGDTSIPAGGISRDQAVILADRAAAGQALP
ncbi:MAG: 6-phosphogluconolactonase [Candidatus Korobacteraceae bacterium]